MNILVCYSCKLLLINNLIEGVARIEANVEKYFNNEKKVESRIE